MKFLNLKLRPKNPYFFQSGGFQRSFFSILKPKPLFFSKKFPKKWNQKNPISIFNLLGKKLKPPKKTTKRFLPRLGLKSFGRFSFFKGKKPKGRGPPKNLGFWEKKRRWGKAF